MSIERVLCLLVTVWMSAASLAQGGLLISVDSKSLAAGSTGTVDVWIESDTVGGDPLFSAFFDLQISSGLRRLEFVDPQGDPQLTLANYVFAGDSFDLDNSIPVGNVATMTVPNDSFTGGDSTSSGGDVTITGPRLLARMQLTTLTALAPQVGDTFTISLNTLSSSFDSTVGPVSFSGQTGTITIVAGSSVIPEPGTAMLCLAACGSLVFWRRRRNAA